MSDGNTENQNTDIAKTSSRKRWRATLITVLVLLGVLSVEHCFPLKMAAAALAQEQNSTAPTATKEANRPESAGETAAPLPVWTSQPEDSPPSSEDNKWAVILLALTIAVGLAFSFYHESLWRALLAAMAWGAFLGFLSDMLIFEGSGGFLSYALLAAVVVFFGRLIRRGIKCIRSKPAAGQSQEKEDLPQ